jgi:GntR family transcriptional regulator/MocR family aminotransferase
MSTDETPRRAVSAALYDEIKARIADGTYAPGMALPSTRALAGERGLSRTTVSLVYEQLAADGFIETRAGAASRVAPGAVPGNRTSAHGSEHDRGSRIVRHSGRLSTIGARMPSLAYPDAPLPASGEIDFIYGPLAGRDFPTLTWLKALRTAERQRPARLSYEDPRGNLDLRKALQTHLSHARGLSCSVEQILIVNGSQQGLDLCARLLVSPGDTVAVENPGYRMAHNVFEAYGAKLAGVDVDALGMRTELLAAIPQAQLAYVTPTHQFPLGAFLPIGRRHALLDWAAKHGTWIIEDDYDSEYRYSVRPEATLQSLDTRECVIHVGTFSKTLSPQLRLGYMVLPPRLVETFSIAKRLTDWHANTGIQRALAALLEDGSYDRHVRRIRRLQHARQHALLEALATHLGKRVEVQGAASGLHLVVWFSGLERQREQMLVEAARRGGVLVYPINIFFHPAVEPEASDRPAGLVMGYALLEKPQIDEGVRRLAAALRRIDSGSP